MIYNRCHDLEDDITSTIWIEVKLPKNKPILDSSIYRQWSLPKSLNIPNSNNIYNQTTRWQSVINKWQKVHNENKEIIIMTDDNMDHNNQNFNNSYKISNIKEITHNFLTNNNYTIHNETNTYYINQTPISCIDHIYSNCPQKVNHVTT